MKKIKLSNISFVADGIFILVAISYLFSGFFDLKIEIPNFHYFSYIFSLFFPFFFCLYIVVRLFYKANSRRYLVLEALIDKANVNAQVLERVKTIDDKTVDPDVKMFIAGDTASNRNKVKRQKKLNLLKEELVFSSCAFIVSVGLFSIISLLFFSPFNVGQPSTIFGVITIAGITILLIKSRFHELHIARFSAAVTLLGIILFTVVYTKGAYHRDIFLSKNTIVLPFEVDSNYVLERITVSDDQCGQTDICAEVQITYNNSLHRLVATVDERKLAFDDVVKRKIVNAVATSFNVDDENVTARIKAVKNNFENRIVL